MAVTATVDSLKDLLRLHGLHVTATRVAVLQVLDEAPGHHSAEEIRIAVLARYPAVDPVTIYRTLEQFESHDLAVRVVLGDKVLRWERKTHAHHHVVCRGCGAVVELEPEPFQRLVADLELAYGIRVEIRHLALQGFCAKCATPVA